MNKQALFFWIVIVLIVFEVVFTGYMAYIDLHAQNVCILGKSCEQVQDTKYGSIFGIKLPFIAFFTFIALLPCYIWSSKLFWIGNFFGLAISLTLIYIQTFILRMYCINCLFVDFTMLLIFFFSFLEFYHRKQILDKAV